MSTTRAYAAQHANAPLAPFAIDRREPGPHDVVIDIAFCGLCHSDVHQVRDEWGGSIFPIVPGHEIVGTVAALGSDTTKHALGSQVGVGCMVDSCRTCRACKDGVEQYCEQGNVGTYNARDHHGNVTYGGYSQRIVVHEDFVLKIAAGLDLARVAPLLCAGITTYSPLRHWKIGAGARVGVVGLGGLGHMGVKLAKTMGAEVTVFTRTDKKKADALALGADEVVASGNADAMSKQRGRFDFILDTVSAEHDYNVLLAAVKRDGVVCCVGAPEKPAAIAAFSLIPGRKTLAGSMIGGIAETQEMLDFCAEHGVLSDIELVGAKDLAGAYERMIAGDVKYRFVLDTSTIGG